MTADTIDRLDSAFRESPIACALERPHEDEITQAERTLGVAFPLDFRDFVLRYGAAIVGPYPVFGLRPVELMEDDRWSVVDITLHWRTQLREAHDWIVISEDHAGNAVCLDTNGQVWIYDHDFGGISLLAMDFESYIRTHCLKVP